MLALGEVFLLLWGFVCFQFPLNLLCGVTEAIFTQVLRVLGARAAPFALHFLPTLPLDPYPEFHICLCGACEGCILPATGHGCAATATRGRTRRCGSPLMEPLIPHGSHFHDLI